MSDLTDEWHTTKINWENGDYYNVSDYNRMIENISIIYRAYARMFPMSPRISPFTPRTLERADFLKASDMNRAIDLLNRVVDQLYQEWSYPEYTDTGRIFDAYDLNSIENEEDKIFDILLAGDYEYQGLGDAPPGGSTIKGQSKGAYFLDIINSYELGEWSEGRYEDKFYLNGHDLNEITKSYSYDNDIPQIISDNTYKWAKFYWPGRDDEKANNLYYYIGLDAMFYNISYDEIEGRFMGRELYKGDSYYYPTAKLDCIGFPEWDTLLGGLHRGTLANMSSSDIGWYSFGNSMGRRNGIRNWTKTTSSTGRKGAVSGAEGDGWAGTTTSFGGETLGYRPMLVVNPLGFRGPLG